MKKIKTLLKQFSFTDHEISVYLAALSLHEPSASNIANQAALNRTVTYFHINSLIKKGVLKETRKRKIKHYIPTPPSSLCNTLDNVLDELKGFIPVLENLQKKEDERPLIEMTSTDTEYFKVYKDICGMAPGSSFRVIEGKKATQRELTMLHQNEWKYFFDTVTEKGIETYGIFTKESLTVPKKVLTRMNFSSFTKRIWHLKTMPESVLPLNHLAFIYNNNVSFLFPEGSFVVTITHPGIASIMASMFDALFHYAEPVNTPWK